MGSSVVVEHLSVRRGRQEVLADLTFRVEAGRITGLLGPSGCGKTTLLRALVWVQGGVRGTVRVLDAPAGSPALRSRVGYVTQAPAVYPDLTEIARYTGVLAPANFAAVRHDLQKKGMLPLAAPFLQASGQLAANLYKEEIERALKTRGVGGFQLLDLHDFPGQGTALVGLLNAFWDSKGLVTPAEFRRFCGPVVPLLRSPSMPAFTATPMRFSAHTPEPLKAMPAVPPSPTAAEPASTSALMVCSASALSSRAPPATTLVSRVQACTSAAEAVPSLR